MKTFDFDKIRPPGRARNPRRAIPRIGYSADDSVRRAHGRSTR